MLYLLIIILIVGIDLKMKNRIEKNEAFQDKKEILGGRIILQQYHNKGAMLNVLESRQNIVKSIAAGLTAGLFSMFCFLLSKKGNDGLKAGVALILGGAFSNLYDRIKRGYVVDYFSFRTKWKKLSNVVFNLGDICIFTGSFLFILWNLKNKS